MSDRTTIENGVIERASLGREDHGILTSFITVTGEGWGQGFGGYGLTGEAAALWIAGILDTLELSDWSALPGVVVRLDHTHCRAHRIGHAWKDKWFDPEVAFAALRSSRADAD